MYNYDELILFQRIYDLTLWLYPIVNKFPKSQKFVLGQKIENCLLDILEDVVRLNAQGFSNRILLEELNIKVDKLRILVRMAKDLRFINIKRYGFFAKKVVEIGNIIGGFKKIKNI
jgi:hypothetical protein